MRKVRSNYLFPDDTFLQGMASIFDIGDSLFIYNESKTGEEADQKAIANDWAVVGEDISEAIEKIKSGQ